MLTGIVRMGLLGREIRYRQSKFLVVIFIWESLSCAAAFGTLRVSMWDTHSVCPSVSLVNSMLRFTDTQKCPLIDVPPIGSFDSIGVVEGDEMALRKALNMVHTRRHEYVAMLFYATWCPFSRTFRPRFSVLSTLYPSIPHFAIEESAIRPSILSKYGVHGFPSLFILNSTLSVRYHGSRSIGSLVTFYGDVTGIKTLSIDRISLENFCHLSNLEKHGNIEQESCPFSVARSPENMFRQEKYLVLATIFVLLRLLYVFLPVLLQCAKCVWTRLIQTVRLGNLLERSLSYLKRTVQSVCSLKEPCKRSNLQEGAINAKTWASKSLATVSIGDASTSRAMHT